MRDTSKQLSYNKSQIEIDTSMMTRYYLDMRYNEEEAYD